MIQQPLGVDADVGSVPGGRGDQPGQVAHGVAGLLRRQIDWVGAARTGWLSWVGLDQPAAVKHLHQLTIRAGRNRLPPKLFGYRIQRLADLDVIVAVHLDLSIDRHRIGRSRRGQQPHRLRLGEHHRRTRARGAVDALPGGVGAPRVGTGLGVGQIGEVLAGEEVAPHVLDHPLDTRFVLRRQLRLIRSVISELSG